MSQFVDSLESRVLFSAAPFGPKGSIPIRGDFNGDGRLEIGALKGKALYLDMNGDRRPEKATEQFNLGVAGIPVVMDVNSNGRDEVGVFSRGVIYMDLNDDHHLTPGTDLVQREVSAAVPVSAVRAVDVDGDGHTDLAIQFKNDKMWRVDFWRTSDDLAALAKELTQTGAKFYGAYWCPHCRRQKEIFGAGARFLPYVECSNDDGTLTQAAIDNNIQSYPTWIFADGTRLTGTQSPDTLSKTAQVPIPSRPSFQGNARVILARLN